MDLSAIRQQIEAAVSHESSTGELRRMAMQACRNADRKGEAAAWGERADEVVAFLKGFVESLPLTIETALSAARDAGAEAEVRPVFEAAISYMNEELDFIPDTRGLAGLVDDAYLVRELVFEMTRGLSDEAGRSGGGSSDRGASGGPASGSPTADAAFREQNRMARRLIGDPTAARLDAAVVAFSRRQDVRATIDAVKRRFAGQHVAMGLPSSMAFGAGSGPDRRDDLPDLQLGQLGDG